MAGGQELSVGTKALLAKLGDIPSVIGEDGTPIPLSQRHGWMRGIDGQPIHFGEPPSMESGSRTSSEQ